MKTVANCPNCKKDVEFTEDEFTDSSRFSQGKCTECGGYFHTIFQKMIIDSKDILFIRERKDGNS